MSWLVERAMEVELTYHRVALRVDGVSRRSDTVACWKIPHSGENPARDAWPFSPAIGAVDATTLGSGAPPIPHRGRGPQADLTSRRASRSTERWHRRAAFPHMHPRRPVSAVALPPADAGGDKRSRRTGCRPRPHCARACRL